MRIEIKYDSCWRNSFLDGENNEPLPKKGRQYIASGAQLKTVENYRSRDITHQTVMGVLNRLIGDQRKLYQSQQDEGYYFKEIESLVQFEDQKTEWEEVIYLRNMTGSKDQNSFSGIITSDAKAFSSDYSKKFWGVLEYDLEELCQFILGKTIDKVMETPDPRYIMSRFKVLGKEKAIPLDENTQPILDRLSTEFQEQSYVNKTGDKIYQSSLFCSALFIQFKRLFFSGYDLSSLVTTGSKKHYPNEIEKCCLNGISKKNFTPKDFMKAYTTGSGKLVFGNPYVQTVYQKGAGKVSKKLRKAYGTLVITLEVEKPKAKEIDQLIQDAGVSAFPLGKKGLAYVSKIKP